MRAYFLILVILVFGNSCFVQDNFLYIDGLESVRKRDSTFLAGPRPLYIVDNLVTKYQALNKIDPRFINKVEFVEPTDIR